MLHGELQRITLADSSSGMLQVLQKKIDVSGVANMHPLKLDLTTDPMPTDRFDVIFSLMTFHHISDTGKILRDLYALLTEPGYLCIADLDSEDGSFHSADFDVHTGFDREALGQMARQAGFREIVFSTVFTISKGLSLIHI